MHKKFAKSLQVQYYKPSHITAMKNLCLVLDTRYTNDSGTSVVKLRISKDKKMAYISTDIKITKEQWNDQAAIVVNHPQARAVNMYLSDRLAEVEEVMLTHHEELLPLSASEIVKKVKAILKPTPVVEEKPTDLFIPYYESFVARKDKTRTIAIYYATLKKLKTFVEDWENLCFSHITPAWLSSFDRFMMEDSPSRNARNIHFRNIRAVFNDAIDEEVITCYPFRKFKLKNEATRKRSFTVEQLVTFFEADVPKYAKVYHDIFKLMFYLIGINTVDLCHLKRVENGRINYTRAKTGRLYSIKVEPEAMAIIEKYKGSDYLLSIMDGRKDYLSFSRNCFLGLQAIGNSLDKKYKCKDYGDISAYWSRHTWATIAAELDIPKETIAAALGHGGREVTDIYIRFDEKKIDEANRKVIDYVNEVLKKNGR